MVSPSTETIEITVDHDFRHIRKTYFNYDVAQGTYMSLFQHSKGGAMVELNFREQIII